MIPLIFLPYQIHIKQTDTPFIIYVCYISIKYREIENNDTFQRGTLRSSIAAVQQTHTSLSERGQAACCFTSHEACILSDPVTNFQRQKTGAQQDGSLGKGIYFQA